MDPHEVTFTVLEDGKVAAAPPLPILTPVGKELLLKIKNLREIKLVVGEPTPKIKVTVLDGNEELVWVDKDGNPVPGANIDHPPPPVGVSGA